MYIDIHCRPIHWNLFIYFFGGRGQFFTGCIICISVDTKLCEHFIHCISNNMVRITGDNIWWD